MIDSLKAAARKLVAGRLEELSCEERNYKSAVIIKKVFEMPEFVKSKNILFYYSKDYEVNTVMAMAEAVKLGKRVFLPRTVKEKSKLELCGISDCVNDVQKGCYGIMEPKNSIVPEADPGIIEVVLVPGMAFDAMGNRLGRGKGYYDRFLRCGKALKIGVAFEIQLVSKLEAQPHDVKMDYVVTEARCLKTN